VTRLGRLTAAVPTRLAQLAAIGHEGGVQRGSQQRIFVHTVTGPDDRLSKPIEFSHFASMKAIGYRPSALRSLLPEKLSTLCRR